MICALSTIFFAGMLGTFIIVFLGLLIFKSCQDMFGVGPWGYK
jgi:hypothetical protein